MEFTDIRPWQWAIVGAGVGCALAYAWTSVEPNLGRGIEPDTFRNLVGLISDEPISKGKPVIDDIVVYPEEKDGYGLRVQQVSFGVLHQTVDGKYFAYRPSHAIVQLEKVGASPSVEQMIEQRRTELGSEPGAAYATFSRPLTQSPGKYYGVSAAIGAATLGIAWPLFMQILIGAGLAPKPEKKEPKFDLSKYKSKGGSDSPKKAVKPGMTSGDLAELDALNAKLEGSVGAGLPGRSGAAPQSLASAEAIRKLDGTADASGPVPEKPAEDPKNFAGEWYPVARPAKHDEQKPH
jgi:hypothetical protein